MNSKFDFHVFKDGTRIEWTRSSIPNWTQTEIAACPSLEKLTEIVGKDFVNEHFVVIPPTDITATLNERGSRYGVFAEHAYIAQSIQNVMRAAPGWARLSCDEAQALTVIADKIARILNGDPHYTDNWHDIQGYAKLVEDRLNSGEPATQ